MNDLKIDNFYNSVVKINCNSIDYDWNYPYQKDRAYKSSASGFFVTPRYIITNAHVVDDANLVTIQIPKLGEFHYTCKIKGMVPEFDLAVIESVEYTSKEMCELETNFDDIQSGDHCCCLGYPLGQSNLKVTEGIISGQQNGSYQVDAPINPGNSGGPLIRHNKVIGISSAGITKNGAQNIGYARPIQLYYLVKNIITSRDNFIIHYPETFGFEYQHLNAETQLIFAPDTPTHNRCGVLVTNVFKDSLIQQTNLRKGDILCSINDIDINYYGQLDKTWLNQKLDIQDLRYFLKLGKKINISYYRGSKKCNEYFIYQEYKLPIRTLYPNFEHIDYIIFAGLILMFISQNYIKSKQDIGPISIGNQSDINYLSYGFMANRIVNKVIITNILGGSMIDKLSIFTKFSIITKINGYKIETLNDVRKAIKTNKNTITTIKTDMDNFVVLNNTDIEDEFEQLSKMYGYDSKYELKKQHTFVED